jgi:hypothetical protein
VGRRLRGSTGISPGQEVANVMNAVHDAKIVLMHALTRIGD